MSKRVTKQARVAGVPRPRWNPEHRARTHRNRKTDYSRKGKSRWAHTD